MSEVSTTSQTPAYLTGRGTTSAPQSANLADVLDRVLDKGVVIAGDIQINLLDIELLTIKLRLLVASVDRAKEMGIDWWEHDPTLSSSAPPPGNALDGRSQQIEERLDRIERALAAVAAQPAAREDGSGG
jgi:hypothetical protein